MPLVTSVAAWRMRAAHVAVSSRIYHLALVATLVTRYLKIGILVRSQA